MIAYDCELERLQVKSRLWVEWDGNGWLGSFCHVDNDPRCRPPPLFLSIIILSRESDSPLSSCQIQFLCFTLVVPRSGLSLSLFSYLFQHFFICCMPCIADISIFLHVHMSKAYVSLLCSLFSWSRSLIHAAPPHYHTLLHLSLGLAFGKRNFFLFFFSPLLVYSSFELIVFHRFYRQRFFY